MTETTSRAERVSWPEREAKKSPGVCRRLLSWFTKMGVTQLLAVICLVLSAVVVGLGLVLGGAVVQSTDQSGRLNNLGTRVNEQQVRIDEQQHQIDSLEAAMAQRSAPR